MNQNSSKNGFVKCLKGLLVFSLLGTLYYCKPSDKNEVNEHRNLEKAKLDAICDSIYRAYRLPGLAIAMRYGGDKFMYSKGIADKNSALPITDSTLFYLGSFSEVPMTMATLQLEKTGKVDLKIPFKNYVPYLNKEFEGIQPNIHHLLSHTSGIEDTSTSWDDTQFDIDELEMTTRSIAGLPLLFAPGSKRTWCGYGFDILADIMQKATCQKFEHLLDSLVFGPIKMDQSTFEIRRMDSNKLAKPQVRKDHSAYTYANADFYPYARENAGGHGFHSSLSDLMKLFDELLTINSDSTSFEHERLFKKQYQTSEDTYTAYGWQVLKVSDFYLYEHSWRHGGFSGSVLVQPEIAFAMVIVTNTISEFVPTSYAYKIWGHIVQGNEMEIKPPYQITMSQQLLEGKTIKEVMEGYEFERSKKEPVYNVSPEVLVGLYSNLVLEEQHELASKLKDYLQEEYPDVYILTEPPPID